MKKVFIVVLVLVLTLTAFTGCRRTQDETGTNNSQSDMLPDANDTVGANNGANQGGGNGANQGGTNQDSGNGTAGDNARGGNGMVQPMR